MVAHQAPLSLGFSRSLGIGATFFFFALQNLYHYLTGWLFSLLQMQSPDFGIGFNKWFVWREALGLLPHLGQSAHKSNLFFFSWSRKEDTCHIFASVIEILHGSLD